MNAFQPGGSRSAQRLPGIGEGRGGNLCVYDPKAVYMQKIKQQFMLLINVSTVIFKNNRNCQPTVFDIVTIWHAAQVYL